MNLDRFHERLLDHFWLAAAIACFGAGAALAVSARGNSAAWLGTAVVGVIGAVINARLDAVWHGKLTRRVTLILFGSLLCGAVASTLSVPWRVVVVANVLPLLYALILGLRRRPATVREEDR